MTEKTAQTGALSAAITYLAVRLTRDIQVQNDPDRRYNLYNTFATTLSYPPLALFDESTARRVADMLNAAEASNGSSINSDGKALPLYYDYVVNYAIGLQMHLADLDLWDHLCKIITDAQQSARRSKFLLAQQGERLTAFEADPVYVMLVVMYEAVAHINAAIVGSGSRG